MKKLFIPFVCLFALFSCKTEPSESSEENNSATVQELQNEIEQLRLDQMLKDSVVNESLSFFNAIRQNLESIGLKKDEIRLRSENPELGTDDKQWMLEEIRYINFLREENARKVIELNRRLKDSREQVQEMEQLEEMVEKLVIEIRAKDEQIATLQEEMKRMDEEYSRLFDAYQEVELEMNAMENQMNTVHYTYGSVEELEENEVIEQKNGFIGIGRKTLLLENFNEDYFAKLDLTKDQEIFIEGDDIRVLTDHPSYSYELQKDGANTKIVILQPNDFWKISRYLVVVVE